MADDKKPVQDTTVVETTDAPAPTPEAVVAPADVSTAPLPLDAPLAPPERGLDRVEDVVEHWVNEHIHNSPVSQATDAFNYLRTIAIPALIAKIKEI